MTWRTTTLVFALLALALGLWGYSEAKARQRVQTELDARYQQSFYELVGHAENVEILLSKGLAAATPAQISQIFTELWGQALAAQAGLTRLPLLEGTMMRTSKFLTQAADFGFTLSKKAASGQPPSADEMELVRKLRAEAAVVTDSLHEIGAEVSSGQAPWQEIRKESNFRLSRDSQKLDQGGFTLLEEHFGELPVIQYDGPFSDHVLDRKPQELAGPEISEEEAVEIALRFAPQSGEGSRTAEVVRRVEGAIPAWNVVVRRGTTDGAPTRAQIAGARDAREGVGREPRSVLDVAMKGGHVVWMLTEGRTVTDERLTLAEAAEKARTFLEERGYRDMVATYVGKASGVATAAFVPEVDGIRIYPDLIKVSVALDDGEVVGFEAQGYLFSHKERKLPKPEITEAEARSRVSPHLKVEPSARLAVIPLPTKEEALTWEVAASAGDERYLIYINAQTGGEERILRLVATPEGELAI